MKNLKTISFALHGQNARSEDISNLFSFLKKAGFKFLFQQLFIHIEIGYCLPSGDPP